MRFLNKILFVFMLAVIPAASLLVHQHHTEQCGLVFDSSRFDILAQVNPALQQELRTKRSVSAADLCVMPIRQLEKAINKIDNPKPHHPGEAATFRYQQQLSEDKQLNVKNWVLAREQVKSMQRIQPLGGGINPDVWESIGPGNIGGRIRSFAFDPDDSTRIYAGAVAGGVWLTENAGASWSPLDDFMGNLSISTLIFDPTNSNTLYAGTGEGTFNADYVRGMGVFKSIDKGVTWTALADTQNDFDFYWVNRITMLNDSSRLLAATHTGIWSSEDGGDSWTVRYSGRTNDINVDPLDNSKLVAGTWEGVVYSVDGGVTWNDATGLGAVSNDRVEIAYAASNPDIVYASIYINSGEIWKSTDGGQSFSLINTGDSYLGQQGWYDNALWVDPTNPEHVIVGGIDLWRSVDAGVSLSKISTWWLSPSSAHADHHFIMEHPDYDGVTNKTVYFANDGGMYVADDVEIAEGSVGWQELNNNLSITQFYGMGVSPDGTVVGGTQDNGTLIYKGDSEGWTETFGGDGGYSASDPTDSNYIYGEYVNLQIHRSTNGGSFSSYIYDNAMLSGANFIAPFILDPNNENRLLGGAEELWVSDNAKEGTPSWNSKKSATGDSSSISAIAVAPGNSDIIYVGHNDGSLYKTSNGTDASPSWTDISGVDLPQRFLMRIAIDPITIDTLYVSFGGYNDDNLWKSIDGGASWSLSVGSDSNLIPPAPIRTIAIHQLRPEQIYVGTEVGIFTSDDGGENWDFANNGPANVSVDELVWEGNDTLYAATHGRGIFKANVREDVPNSIFFAPAIDAVRDTELTTTAESISGIRIEVDVTIVNGEYSLGCTETFTSEAGRANAGDTICLRHTSSAEYFTETLTEVTIGASTFEFESRTVADITPDSFDFDSTENVDLGSEQVSGSVTVTGITNQVDVVIVDGEYSIGCNDSYTESAGSIELGQTICVRHTASTENLVTTTTQLTLGDVTETFESTTLPDITPDAFSFTALDDVLVANVQSSETITISGFQVAIPISTTGGEYSIGCTASFTSSAGEISPDETVCVRHSSSSNYLTETTTTLDVGGVTADFSSTTGPDRDPDSFSFTSVSNAALSTQLTSNSVTISGVAVDVTITVTGGEYSIGCTAVFTAISSSISNGQTVCVRHTSSASNSTSVNTSLTVGSFSASFGSTTEPAEQKSSGGGSMGIFGLLMFGMLFRRNKLPG
jgi:hypothetical protein